MPKADNEAPALDLEQFRGKKWEICRHYAELLGSGEQGQDHAMLLLHKAFMGNARAVQEFLGFAAQGHAVADRWAGLGLASLGTETPRTTGHEVDDLSTDELIRRYRQLSKIKERASEYDWQLEPGTKTAKLVPIADVHICSLLCDMDRFALLCDWLKTRKRNTRWFGAGDLFDLVVKSGVGSTSRQFCSLHRGIDIATEILSPVADTCLGLGLGNHDARLMRYEEVNWDPVRQVCQNLNIEYLGYWRHMVHRVGEQTYTLLYHHGKGAARTPGARLKAGLDVLDTTTDEIVVTAHLHDEMTKKQAKRHIDTRTLEVDNRVQHLAECPSFLAYGDYAAEKALLPSSLGTLSINLGADRHMVHVLT